MSAGLLSNSYGFTHHSKPSDTMKKTYTLPDHVIAMLAHAQPSASAYVAKAVEDRYTIAALAQRRVRLAGLTQNEVMAVCDLLNGMLYFHSMSAAENMRINMKDVDKRRPSILKNHAIAVVRWAALSEEVSTDETLARALEVVADEYWNGGDRLVWLG